MAWKAPLGKRVYDSLFWARQMTTSRVIEELRRVHPQVLPGSNVVFLNDPFQDFDMYFIAVLWFRDPTVPIDLARKMNPPPSPADIEKFDFVFAFRDDSLVQVRPARGIPTPERPNGAPRTQSLYYRGHLDRFGVTFGVTLRGPFLRCSARRASL